MNYSPFEGKSSACGRFAPFEGVEELMERKAAHGIDSTGYNLGDESSASTALAVVGAATG